jgi:hypothetical protein
MVVFGTVSHALGLRRIRQERLEPRNQRDVCEFAACPAASIEAGLAAEWTDPKCGVIGADVTQARVDATVIDHGFELRHATDMLLGCLPRTHIARLWACVPKILEHLIGDVMFHFPNEVAECLKVFFAEAGIGGCGSHAFNAPFNACSSKRKHLRA